MEHEVKQELDTDQIEGGADAPEAQEASPESGADSGVSETPQEPEIDWKDRCLRALAELDNANKTVPKRIQEGIERFRRGHFANLLELADGFERALTQCGAGDDGVWREGVQSLHRMLMDILARSGVKPVEAKGQSFDPAWHEAVSAIPAPDVDEGTILEVLRTGWTLDGRLLRAALVIVARKE